MFNDKPTKWRTLGMTFDCDQQTQIMIGKNKKKDVSR